MIAVLDTSVLIDLLDGDEVARQSMRDLDERHERHAVVSIAAAELWIAASYGSEDDRRHTEDLLGTLRWLEIERSTARRAGQLQQTLIESGSPLGLSDCLIAATSIEHGEELVTRDADFERVADLRVRTY